MLAAVKRLREKNLILTHHQSDPEGGSRPTLYSLNIKQNPRELLMGGIPAFDSKIAKYSLQVGAD